MLHHVSVPAGQRYTRPSLQRDRPRLPRAALSPSQLRTRREGEACAIPPPPLQIGTGTGVDLTWLCVLNPAQKLGAHRSDRSAVRAFSRMLRKAVLSELEV